jgi:hypothetical protein
MLINQADRMNNEAQNALLKTFEEPVHALSIILLTDNPSHLLPTVRSRCWHLPLGLASNQEIATWLRSEFENVAPHLIDEAVRVAAGRPGVAWRELRRLQREPATGKVLDKVAGGKSDKTIETEDDASAPRFVQALQIVERITRSQSVGALALTEEALRLARLWWVEDQADEAKDPRAKDLKLDVKVMRSAIARFLDELANAYRARWVTGIGEVLPPLNGAQPHSHSNAASTDDHRVWADGLDQIRKTRHYILRNANTNLALDVMFVRLIALHRAAPGPLKVR